MMAVDASPVALVVGMTGVTGTPTAEQLLRRGWKVYGLSRRTPQLKAGTPLDGLVHLPVDLSDPRAAFAAIACCTDATHVFHCATAASAHARTQILAHLLDGLSALPAFANIYIMQGMKYYGANLGPFKTPAKETDPRVSGVEFYYGDEDLVRSRQQSAQWTWTSLRPHAVCGYAAGNPLDLSTVIAVYGSILSEAGEEFAFPGTEAAFSSLFQIVDAELLARAAIHVSTTPGCGNQAYNINNGAVFRWKQVWPSLASFFELKPGGPTGVSLSDFFAAKQGTWDAVMRKHQLRAFPFEHLSHWAAGDYRRPNSRLACEHDIIADTVRLRQTGFAEAIDNERMFLAHFERLRAERVIP